MTQIDTQKSGDWHPADVVAALRKAGWSLRGLSTTHGYHPSTLRSALDHSYPNAEKIIAKAIGIDPAEIWPSRFQARDESNPAAKSTHVKRGRNTQKAESA